MNPSPQDDWSDLSQAWTEAGTEPGIDTRALSHAVRRRDLIARLNFYAEAGGAVIAAGLFAWLAADGRLPWPPASVAMGFCAFALVLTLWARRAAPPVIDDTPAGAVRVALQQARAGERWGWSGLAITATAVLSLVVMFALGLGSDRVILAMMIGGVALGAFAVGYGVHIHRCRRRIASHRRRLAEMAEPEAG